MLFFMTRHAEYKQKSTDSPFLNSIRKILWFYLWTRENLCVLIESSFNLGFYPIIHSSLNWLSSNKHCLHFFFFMFQMREKMELLFVSTLSIHPIKFRCGLLILTKVTFPGLLCTFLGFAECDRSKMNLSIRFQINGTNMHWSGQIHSQFDNLESNRKHSLTICEDPNSIFCVFHLNSRKGVEIRKDGRQYEQIK